VNVGLCILFAVAMGWLWRVHDRGEEDERIGVKLYFFFLHGLQEEIMEVQEGIINLKKDSKKKSASKSVSNHLNFSMCFILVVYLDNMGM